MTTTPINRALTVGLAFLGLASVGAGAFVYQQHAPGLEIIDIELGGRGGQPVPAPSVHDLRVALGWDLAFILGYGLALGIGAWLGLRIFWTERGKSFARGALWLTLLAVAADLLEDACLFGTTLSWPSWFSNNRLFDGAACMAVLKFCCLVPSAAFALAGISVALFRARFWRLRHRPWKRSMGPHWPGAITVSPAWPIEDDPTGSIMESGEGGGASRWRRGYRVAGLTTAEARKEAQKKSPVTGICLSGGGVRSAAVSLGAMQELREELLGADYLVSVSGGGYTAGALQLALTEAGLEMPNAEPDPRVDTVVRDAETALMPGSVEEDRYRRHASYIADSPAEMLTALGVLARGVALSLGVLFGPAIVLGVAAGLAYTHVPLMDWSKLNGPTSGAAAKATSVDFPGIPGTRWALVVVLFALALFFYAVYLVGIAYFETPGTRLRALATGVTRVGLLVLTLSIGIPLIAYVSAWLLFKVHVTDFGVPGALASLLLAYATTLASFGRRPRVKKLFKRGGNKGDTPSPNVAVPAGLMRLLLVVVTLVVLAAGWLLLFGGAAASTHESADPIVREALVVLLLLVIFGGLLDQTALSLHPFYRRRLAGAFAARRVQLGDQAVSAGDRYSVARGYPYSVRTKLSEYAQRARTGTGNLPKVVYAAAANLTGEKRAPANAVSYTFTADWVGGPDIGYVRTEDLQNVVHHQLKRDLTVQAAMAISGAAVASAMGRSGRWFGALLAVTGARLGTWLPNPGYLGAWAAAANESGRDWTVPDLPRVRRLPYLVREVFGIHRSTDRLLQITDGGHYENLGLVELFRRRCRLIYCIDSSGDSPPTAGTLSTAIRIAYEELGVEVQLSKDAWQLVPGSGMRLEPTHPLSVLNARLSKQAIVTAKFIYPLESGLGDEEADRCGTLVVAKALLTRDMDYELLAYAASNDVFPHDSTGDQFFDDDKYCAYSSLGREIGMRAREAIR